MNNVKELRRTVLPENIFRLIEGYMYGDVVALHVIAVTKNDSVMHVSAGNIPDFIRSNDDDDNSIKMALS